MAEVLGKCEHCHQPVLSTQEWEKPPVVGHEVGGMELIYHKDCLYYGKLIDAEKDLGWQPTSFRDPTLAEMPPIDHGPEIVARSYRFAKELEEGKKKDGGQGRKLPGQDNS